MIRSSATSPTVGPAAVVFDMDGVIFDTERIYQRALVSALEDAGCSVSTEVLFRTVGLSWTGCKDMLQDAYASVIPVDVLLARWNSHFDSLIATGIPIKPGVLELLDTLDTLSLPRAIATSARPQDVRRNLAAHGLLHRFHAVVAQGDCETTKPAPDPFLLAARRLNVDPSRCLAIEDSVQGVESAVAAGMMTVMVPDTVAAGEREIASCIAVVNDLHEVRKMLEGE